MIDATEMTIERPKKQKKYDSGKKKRHTIKAQLTIYETGQIISTAIAHGSVHDFELFKKQRKKQKYKALLLVDKGYQGFYAVYPNSLLPLKAKKRCKLAPKLKIYNQEIKKRRIGDWACIWSFKNL